MTWTLQQSYGEESGFSASQSFSPSSAITAGSLLVVVGASYGYGSSPGFLNGLAVSDTRNGSWTILDSYEYIYNTNYYVDTFIAYFANAASGTITVNLSWSAALGQVGNIGFVEWQGAATSSVVVAHGYNNGGSGTAITTPSETDVNAGDLVLGYVGTYNAPTVTAGSGTTLDKSIVNASVSTLGIGHLTANSTASSTNNTSFTLGTSNSYQSGTVIFKALGTIAPVNTTIPTISGNTWQGQTLTSTTGTWANSPTSYTYQWINSSTGNISGATSSTYVLQASDVGDTITCQVTATNTAGSASATSNPTATITATGPPGGVTPPVIGDPAIITSLFFG